LDTFFAGEPPAVEQETEATPVRIVVKTNDVNGTPTMVTDEESAVPVVDVKAIFFDEVAGFLAGFLADGADGGRRRVKRVERNKQEKQEKQEKLITTCGIVGGQDLTGNTGAMKNHKAVKHEKDVVHLADGADGGSRKRVERNKFGNIMRPCGTAGCQFKTDSTSNIKNHKAAKHGINVVWFCCDQDGCGFKAKNTGNLKRHKQIRHNIDVVWNHYDLCDHKSNDPGNLKKHKNYIHSIGVVWQQCGLCDYRAKDAGNLKNHTKRKHTNDIIRKKKNYTTKSPPAKKRGCDRPKMIKEEDGRKHKLIH